MVNMISLRTFTLRSLTGHTIKFESNVPTDVPDICVSEAMEKGAVPRNANDIPDGQPANFAEKRAKVEFQGELRASLLYLALKALAEENNFEKFDSAGVPRADTVSEMLGYTVPKKEIVTAYQSYMTLKASGELPAVHPDAPRALEIMGASTKAALLEIAAEMGAESDDLDRMKGDSAKDIRSALLVSLSGNLAG